MAEEWLVIVVVGAVVVAVLFVIPLALLVAISAAQVALNLFAWATEHKFVGVALYIVLWMVAMPIMLTVCLVGGIFLSLANSGSSRADAPGEREGLGVV